MKIYNRILRRETHQSRSTASVVVLALVTLGAVYVGAELVLALLGAAPLLVSPAQAAQAYSSGAAWLPLAGLGALVFGIVLVLVALIPSRRARHAVAHSRMAVVIDDGVLAGSLARDSRLAVGISQNRVRATVSRSRATVTLTPTSGVALSQEDGQAAAERLLSVLNPSPTVRARVVVSAHGVVGS